MFLLINKTKWEEYKSSAFLNLHETGQFTVLF